MVSYLESVENFVNESIEFNVMISLNEAENETIKDKAVKVSAAVKAGIEKIIAKLEQFITKIGEAVKRFTEKARVIISSNGNKAMGKMLKDNSLVVGKDIKLTMIIGNTDGSAIDTLLAKAEKGAAALAGSVKFLDSVVANSDTWNKRNENKDMKLADDVIDAFSKDINTKEHTDAAQIKSNEAKKVKEVYDKYVAVILDPLNKHLNNIQKSCSEGQKAAKEIIRFLKSLKDEDKTAALLATANNYSAKLMKIDTYTVSFASKVLTIATKNSAKIALAAVNAEGKKAAAVAKAAPGKVAAGAKDVAGKAKAAVSKKEA
jgi:hypothetical protein